MRYVNANLLGDVVTSYDQTKTTVFGRAQSKTVDGKTALGPPLNRFADMFTLAATTPAPNGTVCTPHGRLFSLQTETSGLSVLTLFTKNLSTGEESYIGKIQFSMPDLAATTHTFRSIKVLDNAGTTGWKILVTTTASVLINGGTFLVNNIDQADFIPVGFPTIPFATGNDQKAVYFFQDPAALGAGHLQTVSNGSVLDRTASKLYIHTGPSAAHQYWVYDLAVAPTYTTDAITGTEATNLINHAGHTFVNGDQVTFTALTGGTGLNTTTAAYFVVNSVAGVSYQLSATSGGAAINFTTDISAGTIGRAFGISTANFLHRTANLPALVGIILNTDSEDFAQPVDTPYASINGEDCVFFATNNSLYMGKLSELTPGATTWPSLQTVNLLGTPNEIVAPATTYAAWSNQMNMAVYSVGNVFVMKKFENNVIQAIFGGSNNRYFESFNYEAVELQPFTAITSMDLENGWLFITNATTGQRGVMSADLYSESMFDYSYIITKVMTTPQAILKFVTSIDALYDYTGSLDIYYRTSGFGSATGGWVSIPFAEDLTSFAGGEQIQFKIAFATIGLDTSIPAQLCDFYLGYDSSTDNSDHWELSVDDSDNGNPSRTAFRLKTAYASSVPTLRYRALDLSNVLIVNHITTTEAARFQYSTDGGVSWNSLGTIPNTVGTLVRYTFAAPPGVDIRPSLREA